MRADDSMYRRDDFLCLFFSELFTAYSKAFKGGRFSDTQIPFRTTLLYHIYSGTPGKRAFSGSRFPTLSSTATEFTQRQVDQVRPLPLSLHKQHFAQPLGLLCNSHLYTNEYSPLTQIFSRISVSHLSCHAMCFVSPSRSFLLAEGYVSLFAYHIEKVLQSC